MKYFEKVSGDRLYLSPMCVSDAAIYTRWMNDKEVTENIGRAGKVTTFKEEKNWIIKNNNGYNFAIILRDGDRLIGNVCLNDVDLINKTASLVIFIGEKDDRNKGYGKEAIKLILNFGFNSLNLNNIMLTVYSFNERAIKTYEKVGFKRFGVRRACYYRDGLVYDEVYMDILKDEFNEIEDFIYIV